MPLSPIKIVPSFGKSSLSKLVIVTLLIEFLVLISTRIENTY